MLLLRFSFIVREHFFPILRGAGIAFSGLVLAVPLCAAVGHSAESPWVATWGTAMMSTDGGSAPDISGQTLRQIVHCSLGGDQARVWFSNRFGLEPLRIGAAHIALSTNESFIQSGSDRTLTFNHLGSVVIPPGATIVSDPVALHVPSFTNLAISTYFSAPTMVTTEHSDADQVSYAAPGNLADALDLAEKAWPIDSWYFVTGVDVYAPGDSAVVALGDSITDGARSTYNANHRWPDFLAARLAANGGTRNAGVLGIINAGISGNRVLADGTGPNAVSRVNWDVLGRSGVRYLIVLESVNDIARYSDYRQPYGDLEQRLEWGFSQLATQAHQHGILAFGATLTPFGNCKCATPEGKAVREALNHWIRTSTVFDGVVDFDQATRDPQHPSQYLLKFDSDDHVHPSEAGYRAMANAIDLTLFTKKR